MEISRWYSFPAKKLKASKVPPPPASIVHHNDRVPWNKDTNRGEQQFSGLMKKLPRDEEGEREGLIASARKRTYARMNSARGIYI